ncbi:MAG TPA: GYF domain-containing protein [Myxococcales bacterium]|nr:GYF domain-containing protein [Myxococcales bacterium]
MQFGCDSCKAQLQIADEKVRGKRLIVRCKRCGAKIAISDPALAKAAPRVIAPPTAAASVAAQMRAAPASKPVPAPAAPAPVPAPSAPAAAPAAARRDSDTESTRAMDSDLLEKALQASKSDDPSAVQLSAPAPAQNGVPPVSEPPPDAAVWFAMVHGKQAGPMTNGELTACTNQGEIGPRTYLWKEGMPAWQRAKDLPELAALFPQLPESSAPHPPVIPPPAAVQTPFTTPEFVAKAEAAPAPGLKSAPPLAEPAIAQPALHASFDDGKPESTAVDPMPLGEQVGQAQQQDDLFADAPAQRSAENLAQWATSEMEKKSRPPAPRSAAPMFEGAAPRRSGLTPFFIGLAVLAAAGIGLWAVFGGSSEKKDEPQKPPEQSQAKEPAAPAPAPQPAAQAKQETQPPAQPADAKPPEKPVAPAGLTADQVRKKLDENKGALQGCIDEALRRDPNLRVGKIHIATTIAPSGAVTSAKIDKDTVDKSPLGACLKRATRKIAFPGFTGDAFDVDIPIVVTAGE